jgi:hypothetical protein
MKKLLILMSIFIIVPMLVTSIVGLTAVSSIASDAREAIKDVPVSLTTGISAFVGEYVTFLNFAAAELDKQRENAAGVPEYRESAYKFISAYTENTFGVADILIVENGNIYMSYSGNYSSAETFRDISELISIAATSTPVSGFYDGGKFFCGRKLGENGYIVLEAEADLISGFTSDESFEFNDKNTETFTGEVSGTKWKWTKNTEFVLGEIIGIFFIAFGIAAGICLVNVFIMNICTKTTEKEGK